MLAQHEILESLTTAHTQSPPGGGTSDPPAVARHYEGIDHD